MSIHEFGNSVDEIQQKLSEILPLVDAGAERAEQLHQSIHGQLADFENNFESLGTSMNNMGETAGGLDGELAQSATEITAGFEDVTSRLDASRQAADEAVERLEGIQQRVDADIDPVVEQLESNANSLNSEFDSLSQNATATQDNLTTLRQSSGDAFTELDTEVNGFAERWEADSTASEQSLGALKTALSDTHTPEVKRKFNGLSDSTVETVSNVVSLVSNHEGGIGEFFSSFDADVDNLAEEFKSKTEEMFGSLKDYAETQCGRVIEQSLEHLVKEVVEAFAAEVIASVATTQVGVSTTATLSPIIPELVMAKKVTGLINSIL
jgi:chromosome segregation ATPase